MCHGHCISMGCGQGLHNVLSKGVDLGERASLWVRRQGWGAPRVCAACTLTRSGVCVRAFVCMCVCASMRAARVLSSACLACGVPLLKAQVRGPHDETRTARGPDHPSLFWCSKGALQTVCYGVPLKAHCGVHTAPEHLLGGTRGVGGVGQPRLPSRSSEGERHEKPGRMAGCCLGVQQRTPTLS